MNDNDLDTMLREHGERFRTDTTARPAVDWEAVTQSRARSVGRRGWIGAVAATVVVITGVVLALTIPRTTDSNQTGPAGPRPINPTVLPDHYWALRNGALIYVYANGYGSASKDNLSAIALGASPDDQTAYGAYPESGCRTVIERQTVHKGSQTVADVVTLHGRAQAEPMAVSPDGKTLALVMNHAACANGELTQLNGIGDLEIVNVKTGHATNLGNQQVSDADTGIPFGLTWSDDDYLYDGQATKAGDVDWGLTLTATVHGQHGDRPVFSGPMEAAIPAGTVALLNLEGQGHVVAAGGGGLIDPLTNTVLGHGLPSTISTISADPTGKHLLITSGAKTYVWTANHLTQIKTVGTQPAW